MARPMWESDAFTRYVVRATPKRMGAWGLAASIKGLPVPVFLALAADVYAEHLERLHARWKRSEDRRKARAVAP